MGGVLAKVYEAVFLPVNTTFSEQITASQLSFSVFQIRHAEKL